MEVSESKEYLISQKLKGFVPEGTELLLATWIIKLRVKFKISKPRASKFGDFRPAFNGKPHRISVNGNLNRYAFLITSVHEFAHLGCWLKHKNAVSPHGDEWKDIFKTILEPFLLKKVFPEDIQKALSRYLKNPKASSCSDANLMRTLQQYNKGEILPFLMDIDSNSKFIFQGVLYLKKEKKRSRYLCQNLENKRLYLINGIANVEVVL